MSGKLLLSSGIIIFVVFICIVIYLTFMMQIDCPRFICKMESIFEEDKKSLYKWWKTENNSSDTISRGNPNKMLTRAN